MLKLTGRIATFCLLAFFLLTSNPAQAGGPPPSEAFVFCTTNKEVVSETSKSRHRDEFLDDLEKNLGTAKHIHSFWLEDNMPISYSKQARGRANPERKEVINWLKKNCQEDTSYLENHLPRKVEAWIDHLDNRYGQGSILLIAPYSDQNLKLVKESDIPNTGGLRSFPFLITEIENEWIFAYTSHSSELSRRIFSLIAILLINIAFVYFFLNLKKPSKERINKK